MFKFKRKNKKGFTLTEMLVVVLVISVLAVVAIPSYNRAVERTRAAQGITTLQNIAKAQANYVAKRGSYTPNMYSLPIDLKDKDGKDIEGSTFDDQYFGYTVYGDILSQSIAKREDGWNYELAIDYETGKLYCSPADNAICGMLGFEENTKKLPVNESESRLFCTEDDCYIYDGDMTIGKCCKYCEGSSDQCLSSDKNGFYCQKDWCATFEDGVALDGTRCDKDWVNAAGTACAKQTFECDKDKGICVTYKDGEEIESCPINKTGNGCMTYHINCKQDGYCETLDENGNKVSSCEVFNKEGGGVNEKCAAESGYTGSYCLGDTCYNVENGKETWKCEKTSGKCFLKAETCVANETFTGCAEEGTSSGSSMKCDGDKCYVYDGNGKEIGSCDINTQTLCYDKGKLSGVVCDGKQNPDSMKCYTYENGDWTSFCSYGEKKCYDKNGKECNANATFSGCAEEGSSGIINCKLADWKCMEENKYSGTLCDEDGSHCRVYKDGVLKEEFNCDSSACVTYDADGNQTMKCLKEEGVCNYSGGQCKANATFTGCADDSGVVYSGTWQCGGNTCKLVDEKGNVIQVCNMSQGSSCFENNKVDGVVCVEDGTCYTYENGKNVLKCQNGKCYDEKNNECVANYYGTACKPEGNSSNRPCEVSCKNGTCSCWDENGALYFNCPYGDNECFKNVGFSGTYCDEDGNCSTYENGEHLYQCANSGICVNKITGKECTSNETFTGCADEATSANGLKCEGFTCTDDWGKTCYDNGKGECIKGDGLELACYKDKGECHWYENGKEAGSCAINEAGTGCKEESSGSLDDYKYTVCDSNGECYGTNDLDGKIGNGVICDNKSKTCDVYKGGKVSGTCDANDTLTGCKEESTSSGADYTCDGWTCVDDNGLYVCDSNGKGGCIEGKGEEVICMDGQCMTYKDGQKTEWCTANEAGTGCKEESTSSSGKTFKCTEDGVCTLYENGKEIGTCAEGSPESSYGDKCAKQYGASGSYCYGTDTEKACKVYENGKQKFKCRSVDWTCDYDGGTCDANDTLTGCKEESTSSGSLDDYKYTVCDSNGECKATNNSDEIVNNGIVCDKESKTCDVYKDGKKTDWCEANDEGTGCKATAAPEAAPEAEPAQPANGLICEDWECKEYKDGEAVSSCYSNGDGGCIEGKGTEFVCIDGKCYHYENGEYKNSCNANATGDGCSKDGFSCSGETCTEVKYGEKTTCYNNGNGGCIEGKGQEFACVDGKCYTYKDGKLESSCEANSDGTGCKQESSSTLDPETSGILCYQSKCKQFENGEMVAYCYYDEAAGETSCKPNETNTGDSLSAGNSGLLCNVDAGKCYTYKDGKLESSCNINSAGDGCAPVSSSLVCKDGSCTYYKEDGNISYTCKTGDYECFLKNGGAYVETTCDGGYCMTHEQGKPNYYCSKDGDGTCYYYDNNMKIQTCTANATYSGCK